MQKRFPTIIVAAFCLISQMFTHTLAVTPVKAIKKADELIGKHTSVTVDSLERIFLFESDTKGFALVDAEGAVIGYSTKPANRIGNIPPAMKTMLNLYSQSDYRASHRSEQYNPKLLVTPSFDQREPFNNNINGNLVGCVGTAMAIVMKYHNWPPKGRNSITYDVGGQSFQCDFSSRTFNWDDILEDYSGDYSSAQGEAVANLCEATALSVKTIFGNYSSGAYSGEVPTALKDYFYYSKGTYIYSASNTTPANWEKMLRDEIDNGRPVIYFGAKEDSYLYLDDNAGHAFIIDGYDSSGLFHINWGWGGAYDGYFALTNLQPTAEQDFSHEARGVFGISPDYGMENSERVVVYLSSYHPNHIDGMYSNSEYVLSGRSTGISNFCWKVVGEPFKNLKTAVAHCDKTGNFKHIYDIVELDPSTLSIQNDGFQGYASFIAQEDAVEGDYLCMIYTGDDMHDWRVMGEEGPIHNYCSAYGCNVVKCPVIWKNTADFEIIPERYYDTLSEGYIHGIVPNQYWTVTIEPKKDFAHYHLLINGSMNAAYFHQTYLTDYTGTRLRLQCNGDISKDMSFEFEMVTVTPDEVETSLISIAGVTPGKLEEMTQEIAAPKAITRLKLQGRITDTDFDFMRESMFMLEDLDLQNVTIAAHDYNPADYLPYKCFENKYSLKKLILPERLAGFHNNSLANTGIENIYIPSTAVNFGLNVLNSCASLKTVTVAQNTPPVISWCVLNGIPREEGTLIVPAGTRELYCANPEWGQFGTIVEDENVVDGIEPVINDNTTYPILLNGTIHSDNSCEVYDISGRFIGSGYEIQLPSKGLYIIRCGEQSFKTAY